MPKDSLITIIAGSRGITDPKLLQTAIEQCGWDISTVVCGLASGPDTLGMLWARKNNIPVAFFPANWKKYGISAGMYRNMQMAEASKALISLWDGTSKGTANMINTAKRKKLKVHVQLC
jgi:hypothetical protein